MTQYWFARYKPGLPSQAGRGLVPLNWKGVATIAGFIASLLVGGALFLYFGLHDEFIVGVPAFVVLAIAGFVLFIWASVAKTDPKKSIYEYQAGRVK